MAQTLHNTARRVTRKGEPFYFFHAAGTDYEIGLTKGEQMAADIIGAWEFFEPCMAEQFGTPVGRYQETYEWLRQNLETIAPWMVEQICGMAEGSGLAVDRAFLLNHYGVLWCASGLFCTSVAIGDTVEGPVLGQNLDIGDDDLYFVEELHPQNGFATLSDGMAGMCWSPTGINERGLAIGASNLASPARQGTRPITPGMPYHFLTRLVLRECACVAEAVEYLAKLTPVIPPGGGYQLNLLDSAGNMAVVDKSEDRTVVRQCEIGMNFTTNYSLDADLENWRTCGEATEVSFTARSENICSRYRSQNGKLSREWLIDILQSHADRGRLCCHGTDDVGGAYTRLSFIYCPSDGSAQISNGLPCVNKYQVFRINHRGG